MWLSFSHCILSVIVGLVLHSPVTLAHVENQSLTEQQLKTIKQNIQNLQKDLVTSQVREKSVQQKLADLDQVINESQRHLDALEKSLLTNKAKIQQQNAALKKLQQTILQKKHHFSESLKTGFYLQRHPPISALIEQPEFTSWLRLKTYYSYIYDQNVQKLAQLDDEQLQVKKKQAEIEQQGIALSHLKIKRQSQLEQQTSLKKTRLELLKTIHNAVEKKQIQLADLSSDVKRLETVLQKIKLDDERRRSAKLKQNFQKMRGSLPWPVTGKLQSSEDDEQISARRGVFIGAKEDQAVKAVYAGTVVFADWLKNFGLLLIIQHAEGYMSLYAHNNTLYKQVGDNVDIGDVVGSTGRSGGIKESGLYFEIRHNGKPLDPKRWLSSQGGAILGQVTKSTHSLDG